MRPILYFDGVKLNKFVNKASISYYLLTVC